MRVYLDNAATTPLHPEVLKAMLPYLEHNFGNPSAQYEEGRTVKSAIETACKQLTSHLKVTPGEIIFTSGGTESNNMALQSAVNDQKVRRIITTTIEHHCVAHTVEYLRNSRDIDVIELQVDSKGYIDIAELERYLSDTSSKTLVSIMHGNNEIGTMQDIETISTLCKQYSALFHSDTVQTFGHYPFDLSSLELDYISASAHKFHGPKGIGFLYIKKSLKGKPLLHGGGQERNMRAGTENVVGIIGMGKAISIAYDNMDIDRAHILSVKKYAIDRLKNTIADIEFNGDIEGLYTVLSLSLPSTSLGDLMLFKLDMEGISASSGSACSSGATTTSHVMQAIQMPKGRHTLRVSFSKFNTQKDIDRLAEVLERIYLEG